MRATFPLVPRRPVGGRPFGPMPSGRRGPGWDVAGSRPYRPGDDVRRIDWRASARLSSASDGERFVVREHRAEQAASALVLVDRRPSMALFPRESPWLHKPSAVETATSLVAASAAHAGSRFRRLDAGAGSADAFAAREESLAGSLAALVREPVSPGSFLFVLSDFLAPVPADVWRALSARGWDVVPVLVQDPVWERSFPAVAGAVVELAEPNRPRGRVIRLGRSAVGARRRANEARTAHLLETFRRLGLDRVDVACEDESSVLDAFRRWAAGRRRRLGSR